MTKPPSASNASRVDVRGRRTAARVAAIQALYEMEIGEASAETVIDDVIVDAWRHERVPELPRPDAAFVRSLVAGATDERAAVDRAIESALTPPLVLDRLEAVLRAILRVAAFEILFHPDVPVKVVINEHVNVAHAFFCRQEAAIVNAVLDRLAADARPATIDAAPSDHGPGR
jgi:N utilization substance protein B